MDRPEQKFSGQPRVADTDAELDRVALRYLNQEDTSNEEYAAIAIKLAERAALESGIEIHDIEYDPKFSRVVINRDKPIDATVELDYNGWENIVSARCRISERFDSDRNIDF